MVDAAQALGLEAITSNLTQEGTLFPLPSRVVPCLHQFRPTSSASIESRGLARHELYCVLFTSSIHHPTPDDRRTLFLDWVHPTPAERYH